LTQGAEVSLSGNLGFVSLDEVLRLLNRSNQRGMVDVNGDGVHGRIFFDRGAVTLATTFDDEELHEHIGRSGMPEGVALASMLREMAVETLYRLGTHGKRFDVVEQQPAPIGAGTSFDLEELLADSRRRFDEWAEVSAVVTDLDALVRLRRDLGERDRVTIDRDSWRLLSEVGHGSSVKKLAKELGATDFWAAKVAVGMIEEDLLDLDTTTATATAGDAEWTEPADTSYSEPEPAQALADVGFEEPAAAVETQFSDGAAADAEAEEEEGVFAEDVAGDATSFEFGSEEPTRSPTEEPAEPAASVDVDPNESWWTEPEPAGKSDESGEVEEDTEAFLEKVFSGLENNEPQEEGYGLLRRRRLGALRDLSNDS
jgi:hypothetical protein